MTEKFDAEENHALIQKYADLYQAIEDIEPTLPANVEIINKFKDIHRACSAFCLAMSKFSGELSEH